MRTLLTSNQTVWMFAVIVGTLVARADYSTATADPGVGCEAGFERQGASCYQYSGHHVLKAFHQAEKACRRRSGYLVSVQSSEEHDFVAQLAGHNSSFWIGLNDADEYSPGDQQQAEGAFIWTEGKPFVDGLSYSKWKDGEPANHVHLDCVRSDADGWWMARGGCGSTRLPYVCETNACPPGLRWNGETCAHAASSDERMSLASPRPSLLPVILAASGSVGLLVAMTCFVCYRTIGNKTHAASSKFILPT